MPFCTRPLYMAAGIEAFNPTTISENMIAIDIGFPMFITVARMPEPAPRCSGGKLFMTAAILGDMNIPIDMPSRKITAANNG